MSWAVFRDDTRGYALSGNIDDIVRVVGSEKLPCGRNGSVIEDGELGP